MWQEARPGERGKRKEGREERDVVIVSPLRDSGFVFPEGTSKFVPVCVCAWPGMCDLRGAYLHVCLWGLVRLPGRGFLGLAVPLCTMGFTTAALSFESSNVPQAPGPRAPPSTQNKHQPFLIQFEH